MEKKILKAIELRQAGKLKESSEILLTLVKEYPHDAYLNYQCAWSLDLLGEETAAVPFYEVAINLGLDSGDLEGALLGLGSTYRTIGEYEKSRSTLLQGMEAFPKNKSFQVFYSMTLYNLNDHNKAMEILLKCLLETTSDDQILRYKRAIDFYSTRLDEVWK